MRLARRLFDGTVAEMQGTASAIYLTVKADGTSPSPRTSQVRHYQRHWTPVHLDFVVADLDGAVEKARAAGATLEARPASFVWGRLAAMSDPFGNGLCFIQWIGRGYGEVGDG